MKTLDDNVIALTDSYKVTHWPQYPPGTTYIHSFLESRGGERDEITFFGLQYYLERYLEGQVVTEERIAEEKEDSKAHFGSDKLFNEAGWRYLLEKHGGKLPLEIRAVPEGMTVPVSNVLMTIVNTDPNVPWLTNYFETLLEMVWYPTTVCTRSREMKKVIKHYLDETGDPGLIDFKLHDFGFRGSTSVESAGIGGAAHLVNFKGTDTKQALRVARKYYYEPMAGFSVPAAEHSTITSWGKDHEVDAFRNMLDKFPKGIVAVVSDSYDIFAACRDLWGKKLRDRVLERDGVLVVRPDSGPPADTVLEVLDLLEKAFGYSFNEKYFKVLNPKIRVIQGDGIDYASLKQILSLMTWRRWAADNIAFGSGGGLLQKNMDRDTHKFAIKCSAVRKNGEWHDVMKDPITDSGKRSKAGRLKLVRDNGKFKTVTVDAPGADLLEPVFRNGEVLKRQSFAEIRERAALD